MTELPLIRQEVAPNENGDAHNGSAAVAQSYNGQHPPPAARCRCDDPLVRHHGPEQVCWHCWQLQFGGDGTVPEPESDDDRAALEAFNAEPMPEDLGGYMQPFGPTAGTTIVTLEEFAAVDEPGAAPLIGDAGSMLIAEGSDVMLFGDGGSGKTTLSIDLACHLAAGDDWLQIPVQRPARVLLIEAEGPRPLFRKKLREKLEAWTGSPLAGRVSVFEAPWARFTFAELDWRSKLAEVVKAREIDVVIAGPLTRIGMDAAGTLQEVRAFMELVADTRAQCGRLLTLLLVHHESKSGAVSGAWEGAGDTLLHAEAAGNGHTVVHVQKARWASDRHGTTLKLAWTDGEGFRLEGDRDYMADIVGLLAANAAWRTTKEIAAPKDKDGIGANEDTVRNILDDHPERFENRTGKAAQEVGRSARASVWQLRQGSDALDSVGAFSGGAEEAAAAAPSLKGAAADERTPHDPSLTALDDSTQPTQLDPDAELERVSSKFPGLGEDL